MKKALRAGILAAALAASSVTVVNAPVVFAAEGDAAAVGTGNEAVTTAGTGTDGAGKTDQPAKTELDIEIERVEGELATAIALRDQTAALIENLKAAIEGKAEPSPELKKAYEDAKAAEAAKKGEYDAAKSKLDAAKKSQKNAETALAAAQAATAQAQTKVNEAKTKVDQLEEQKKGLAPEAEGSLDEKIQAARAELATAQATLNAKKKAEDTPSLAKSSADSAVLLDGIAFERADSAYSNAQIATKTAEGAMKRSVMSVADATTALTPALVTLEAANGVITAKQAELNKLKAKKENQGKGSSLPAFKDGEKFTPFGIAVIVISALVAVLGLGAALLPQLQNFLSQLPF